MNIHADSDPAVLNGSERDRYIRDGRIVPYNPRGIRPYQPGQVLNADEMDARGFHAAAHAKRQFDYSQTMYAYGGFIGRQPIR